MTVSSLSTSPKSEKESKTNERPLTLGQTQFTSFLLHWGVETHGISPIPVEQRVDKRLDQLFFVWSSANFNIPAFSTGSAGPAFFSLGLRDTLLILLVVDAIICAVPVFFAIFEPKLGTWGMVQDRFSWGYYGSVIPSILNVISMQGFPILNCIIGGQTLASVSDRLDDTTGIVIIGILSLVVTFFGYKVVHWSAAWIPNVIAFLVMLGLGGKHRYVFAIASEAILIPVAIVGATRFYGTFVNILSIFGYWSTAFAASILPEHTIFRKRDFSRHNVEDWNKTRPLPPGIASVLSFVGAFGITVPSMSQAWYIGPVARAGTGDIGVLTGFLVSAVLYAILRSLECRWRAPHLTPSSDDIHKPIELAAAYLY